MIGSRDPLMPFRKRITINQPLDLQQTLESGQTFRWRKFSESRWVGVIGDSIWVLSKQGNVIDIETSKNPVEGLESSVESYFRLDDDLVDIQRKIGFDEYVAKGIAKNPGLRILRQDPWETLVAFILSSTSNVPRIARTMELLASELGDSLELNGIERNTFPKPVALINAGETYLRDLKCGFRAPYLIAAANHVQSGFINLEELRHVPYDDALIVLKSLPGVAEKIADCVMLFSLDHLEAFPVDRWIKRAMTQWYLLGEKSNYQTITDWARGKFGNLSGYANQYIYWDIRQTERPMIGSGSTIPLKPKIPKG